MPNLITTDISTEVELVASVDQTVFAYPFPIFESGDLRVYLDDVLTSAYIVTGVGEAGGGTVVMDDEQTVGTVVHIVRDVAVQRYVDLPTSGPLDTDDVDLEFDRVLAIMQQLKSGLARTIQVSLGENGIDIGLVADRADRIFTFDALGDPSFLLTADFIGAAGTAATITIGTVVTLAPGAAATVTNVGTAAAAIFNFGIPQGDGAGFTTEQIQDIVAAMMVNGTGMTITYSDPGGTLTFDAALSISDGSIVMAKHANIAADTVFGRVAVGAGVPKALSKTELTTLINPATTTLSGAVPAPGASVSWKHYRGDATWEGVEFPYHIACSDETTAITAGTNKAVFRLPFAATLVDARASLTVDQSSGSIFTVDVHKDGTTVLSTKLTIDNTERTSVTAATQRVISVASFAADAEVSIDVDQVGNGTAKGLKVMLLFRRAG